MEQQLTKHEAELLLNKWYEKPEIYFKDILGVSLWEKQQEIIESIKIHRRTSVRSCNSAGKTWSIARIALWFLSCLPHSLVINTAPTHRQVENQFWRQLRLAHKKAKINIGGKLLKTMLSFDEDWYAIGFSPKDGDSAKETFQGWHAKYILVIVDEASGVHPSIFEAIEGAMAGGSVVRLVLIGNPTRTSGDFYNSFSDSLYNKIKISAFDIPNVKEKREIIAGLATFEWVEEMKKKYGENSDVYRVRVLGEPPKHEADTLISLELVESAIGADRERYGTDEFILLDPARFGADKAGFVYKKGNYAKVLEIIDKSDTMELAGKMARYLDAFPEARGRIDIIGLGAGIFDRLKEQPKYVSRVEGVNVGTPAVDKEHYVNQRAESLSLLKEWLRDAILDDTEHKEEWYQLCKPKVKIRSDGKIILESKEDMKKRGIPSPEIADALSLAFCTPTETNLGIGWSWG